MVSDIATLVLLLVAILSPLLIPVTVTAAHAVAEFRRPRTHARTVRAGISHRNEPIPASA